MVLKVINKINSRLRLLLCNAIIQPHFDYACSAWYPNLSKKLKSKLETIQSKCIRFCLQLSRRNHIVIKEFEQINQLPVSESFNECIFSNAFNFFNENFPLYLYDLYKPPGQDQINARSSILKPNHQSRSTCSGQNTLSYLTPTIWNNLLTF